MSRIRLYLVGLIAFLVGFPLTTRAFGQSVEDIVWDSVGLGFSTSNESDGS
jgi:hypothetical protein